VSRGVARDLEKPIAIETGDEAREMDQNLENGWERIEEIQTPSLVVTG